MIYLVNAFSLNMLPPSLIEGSIRFRMLSLEEARSLLANGFVSGIGHADTAQLLTQLLGLSVQENRANITLTPGATLVVAQYRGPRLPEGTTVLPQGAQILFYLVELV
ncbi:MAG: DUF1874 domain-containing protein [Thermus sp.]